MTENASSGTADSGTPPAADVSLFQARNLRKQFGSLVAIDDLSFDVLDGEILGIAGPNGAGKSTLLNLCTGIIAPDSGSLEFRTRAINRLRTHQLCHAGIARTFQVPAIFESLSVRQNVEIGAMFGGPEHYQSSSRRKELVEYALSATGLADRMQQRAGTLSLLARKMTMLAAALATQPSLMFMDEPMGGLTQEEVEAFSGTIRSVHERFDLAFVIVEHKIRALTELSDRMMIMHFGSRICLDRPEVVIRDERVMEVYLGNEDLA